METTQNGWSSPELALHHLPPPAAGAASAPADAADSAA